MTHYPATVQNALNRIDKLQSQIEQMRPIKPEITARIFQKFRLDWNYNSNSIEGNSLNYGETVAFLMEGLTAKGKPLKDHLDIKGHNEAIDFLLDMQQQGSELTERDIRSLHQLILVEPYQSKAQTADGRATTKTIQLGVYKTSPNHVVTKTGETHYYATPEETPALMHGLMTWYRAQLPLLHPLVPSALFHHKFVAIHPFDDGNGRMARLLSNLLLLQAGYPPVVVRQDQRSEYYGILSQADAGVTEPLLEYFAGLLLHSLNTYLKGARGEDISEPSDLDKEIALFVASFDEQDLAKLPLSEAVLTDSPKMIFDTFFSELKNPTLEIGKLFFNSTFDFRTELVRGNTKRGAALYKEFPPTAAFTGSDASESAVYILLAAYKKEPKDNELLRLTLNLSYNSFKASEIIGEVSGFFIFDFAKSYYAISALDEGRARIQKPYPAAISQSEAQTIIKEFFQELMNSIRTKVKAR